MRTFRPMIAALAAVTIAFAACERQTGEEAGTAEEETAADTVAPEAGIQDLEAEYERAYGERDWDALIALHTDDYREVTAAGEVRTRADVEASLRDTTSQPPADARVTIDTESIEVAGSGDLAYATGTSTLTATGPDGQPITEETHWMAGFDKVDGQWKLDRLVLTPVAAPAEEAAPADTGTS